MLTIFAHAFSLVAGRSQAEAAKARVVQLEREVTQLYKDKSRLLEELVAAGGDLTVARRQVQALEGQLTQVRRGGQGTGVNSSLEGGYQGLSALERI